MPNVISSNDVLTDLFDVWNDKKQKVSLTFKEDPIVLACGAWKMGSYPNLEDVEPTAEDRELGARVRKHFMNKLVIQRLRGGPVSTFREKLGAFLVDNRPIYKNEIGMLYHLPYFYFEDLNVEKIIESTSEIQIVPPVKRGVNLKPHSTNVLKRRGGSIVQFWWTDNCNHPYCLNVRENSEGQALINSLYKFSHIDVLATMYPKSFLGTDRHFYKLVATELLGASNERTVV